MPKPTLNFTLNEKPPTCLHILGQGLVDACHKEARALFEYCHELEADLQALSSRNRTVVPLSTIPEEHKEELDAMQRELDEAHKEFLQVSDEVLKASETDNYAGLSALTIQLQQLGKRNDSIRERQATRLAEMFSKES